MKPTYLKVSVRYLTPAIEALQVVVDGQVVGYVDSAGNAIDPSFSQCEVLEEVDAPAWAPEVAASEEA